MSLLDQLGVTADDALDATEVERIKLLLKKVQAQAVQIAKSDDTGMTISYLSLYEVLLKIVREKLPLHQVRALLSEYERTGELNLLSASVGGSRGESIAISVPDGDTVDPTERAAIIRTIRSIVALLSGVAEKNTSGDTEALVKAVEAGVTQILGSMTPVQARQYVARLRDGQAGSLLGDSDADQKPAKALGGGGGANEQTLEKFESLATSDAKAAAQVLEVLEELLGVSDAKRRNAIAEVLGNIVFQPASADWAVVPNDPKLGGNANLKAVVDLRTELERERAEVKRLTMELDAEKKKPAAGTPVGGTLFDPAKHVEKAQACPKSDVKTQIAAIRKAVANIKGSFLKGKDEAVDAVDAAATALNV
ncbi:hypothetical protein JNJ66_05665 [Candidatus Saccharibacteria bacterium]|nr:hypothetical protein [Candidatus Saccharibacteria bacterium]